MNTKKALFGIMLIPFLAVIASCSSSGGSSSIAKKTIIVDGGGDIGNFNSTASMTKSEANPFPYNTLRTLCDEWEAQNPEYEVQINRTSSNGDRTVLVPQLNQHTAPDITYQNGTVINTDLGKDYYVSLTDYFNQPNPYVADNAHWKDIYASQELAQTMASDGNYYTVCLEKIPVGIMYNKTLLAQAGITTLPETFGTLLEDMAAVNAIGNDVEAYSTTYNWYNIALESNMFSDLLATGDVLRANGVLDTEELVRLYSKGQWDPTVNAVGSNPSFAGNKYYDYIKLCATLGQQKAPLSYDAHSGFVAGKLAFLEVTGKEIRKLSVNSNIDFEWGVMPFPDLSVSDYTGAASPSVRGTAGLATAWFITNSAVDKGTVDGCVDLMMFLTAPQNNNRLIGDLKGGLPLNPDSSFQIASYLENLVGYYNQDMTAASEGKRVYWACVNSWAILGFEYNTAFIKTMQDIDNGIKTPETAATYLAQVVKNTIAAKLITEGYDQSAW